MTIHRKTVIQWLYDWKESVEGDSMFPCCQSAIISELDNMIETVEEGFLEVKQKRERL